MLQFTGFIYCPGCGKQTLEVHQKNGVCCTSCGYTYFHNTASAAAGIIEIDGKILLTTRGHEPKKGMFDLPGGFVDYNESAETALVREIKEELGIEVNITGYLGSFPNRYEYKNIIYFTSDTFLICRPATPAAPIVMSDEIHHWELFAPEDIPFEKLGFESNVRGLREYVARRG